LIKALKDDEHYVFRISADEALGKIYDEREVEPMIK
jgi:HEAT repeat protein